MNRHLQLSSSLILTWLYCRGNKSSALIIFPSHKIIMLNFVYCCKPCPMYEYPVGRCKTYLGLITWWEPPPFSLWQACWPIQTKSCALFCQYPEVLSHGLVISLIGSHPSSSYSTTTPPSSESHEKEYVDSCLGCHSTYFPVRFLAGKSCFECPRRM